MGSRLIPSNFVKNVMQNGIGRYICQLQRVTIEFCKSNGSSRGTRDFIENYLLDFAKSNPGIVMYLRPRRHKHPHLRAEYLNGYKESIPVANMSKDEVAQWLGILRGRTGVQIVRLRKPWHTDNPSIQGIWHPFMFKDPSINSKPFPKKLPAYKSDKMSATEYVLQLKQEQLKITN
ncbi:hypothetical protein CHS0354_006419 [Potamilus streckersoni]|uniref:Large ribosomal subunit protein mL43 n=1 Tax=Potamilus streckersoni TaxID=2493646 RepID=A0AAE0TA21_9BIVA|nr:hypothetical protein CHS0354_006419 [Potamilus streckersoni]